MQFFLYQPLLVWLIFAAIFEFYKPKSKINRWFFLGSISIMAIMQFFRYGQGPDYWGYRKLYVEAPLSLKYALQYLLNARTHCEIGFKILNYIFRLLGLSSFWFYAILGTTTIVFIAIAINRYAKLLNLANLIFYPTLYLSYVMSGVRQAFSTSLFLCFGLKALYEKKYMKYTLIVILCACFHKYTLILLILIPLSIIHEKKLLICVPIVWCVGLIYTLVTPIHVLLSEIISEQSQFYRFTQINISWLGIAERTICFAIISFLFWIGTRSDLNKLLYKIYTVGYLINILLMTTDYGSQRITMPVKMVEIILIPLLISECTKRTLAFWATITFIAVETVMSLKNLHFYSVDYNSFNYPYVSVFGIDEALSDDHASIRVWEDMWNDWYESYPTGTQYIHFYFKQLFEK